MLRAAGVSSSLQYDVDARKSTLLYRVGVDDFLFSEPSLRDAYVTNVLDAIADHALQVRSVSFLRVQVHDVYKQAFVLGADELVATAHDHAQLRLSFNEASVPAKVAFYASVGLGGLTSLLASKQASSRGVPVTDKRYSVAGGAVALSAVLARPVTQWYVNRRTALADRVRVYEAIRAGLD